MKQIMSVLIGHLIAISGVGTSFLLYGKLVWPFILFYVAVLFFVMYLVIRKTQ